MPTSRCVDLSQGKVANFYCLATADRYTIEAQAAQLLDAQQKTAAQYAMLGSTMTPAPALGPTPPQLAVRRGCARSRCRTFRRITAAGSSAPGLATAASTTTAVRGSGRTNPWR